MNKFKKIQPSQINIEALQLDGRLSIFMVDVQNTSLSNTINVNRYNTIGDIQPVESFSTNETSITLTIEWEGPARIWDGKLFINDQEITEDNTNAVFESLGDTRRFRCIYNMNIYSTGSISFHIENENEKIVASNSVNVLTYETVNVESFAYLFGSHNSGEVNTNGSYPTNTIYYSGTPTEEEQQFLKQGDWVAIRAEFDESISQIRIIDDNNVFLTEPTVFTFTPNNIYEAYLQVQTTSNISNVELKIQGFSEIHNSWSFVHSTNQDGFDSDMENIVNINNDYPDGSSEFIIGTANDALNINESGSIFYTLIADSYWDIPEFTSENTGLSDVATNNFETLHEELILTIKSSATVYNLAYPIYMPIINIKNGITDIIQTNIPIASIDPTVTFNELPLKSDVGGKLNTLTATFNQELDTDTPISISNVTVPDSNIILSNFRYIGDNQISIDTVLEDNYLRGDITFTLVDVTNLSGRQNNYIGEYIFRGFEQRTLTGTQGDNRLTLVVNILDESGFNAVLNNNEESMNYKNWNSGTVLTSDAMTKTTGLATSDQYAYTFDPVNKEIVLGEYIMATIMQESPSINISKS